MSFKVAALVATALAYSWLSIALTFRGTRTRYSSSFAIAAAATAIWLLAVLASVRIAAEIIAPLRDAAWLALLLILIQADSPSRRLFRGLVLGAVALTGLNLAVSTLRVSLPLPGGLTFAAWTTSMAIAAFGLLLVENIARNARPDRFWARKLLCIGLGLVFAFNLVAQIPQAFFHRPAAAFADAEPFIFLLALPLLVVTGVRMPVIALRVHSSRQAVFHSATLVAIAVMIEGMAVAAYFVRRYGGDMATTLSIVLLFSAAMAALTALASTTLRSRLRHFISENFFSYKYDYRTEWGRFIASLSARDDDNMPLRVLRTFAELMDCPGGLLLIRRSGERQLNPLALWSVRAEPGPLLLGEETIAELEKGKLAYIRLGTGEAAGLGRIWNQQYPFGWLAVPLLYRGGLVALAVLSQPRVPRKLNWEDERLIGLVAQHLAIYLVHDEARKDLDDARQLEAFTSKVAFVIHDMKNGIGQLALLARNVERFGHDENFRKDMVATIQHSVSKLQELMQRLRHQPAGSLMSQKVDLCALLDAFARTKERMGLPVTFCPPRCNTGPIEIAPSALLSVLEHVVANAVEAAPGLPVHIGLERTGASLRVSVKDRGKGMETLAPGEMFRPFRSTKTDGLGLGAYQARQTMRELRGDLEITSNEGGTTVELLLPAMEPAA